VQDLFLRFGIEDNLGVSELLGQRPGGASHTSLGQRRVKTITTLRILKERRMRVAVSSLGKDHFLCCESGRFHRLVQIEKRTRRKPARAHLRTISGGRVATSKQ
jgi:hypothetical protein